MILTYWVLSKGFTGSRAHLAVYDLTWQGNITLHPLTSLCFVTVVQIPPPPFATSRASPFTKLLYLETTTCLPVLVLPFCRERCSEDQSRYTRHMGRAHNQKPNSSFLVVCSHCTSSSLEPVSSDLGSWPSPTQGTLYFKSALS